MMKKWGRKARKKGNVILMSLMSMIIILVMAGTFINLFLVYETLNRGIAVVEEAARVRAQAVDVPLKEYTGYIEVLHPNYGYMDHDNIDHDAIDQKFKKEGAAGHTKPQNPTTELYQNAATAADKAAKEAALRMLSETVGVNATNKTSLITMTKDDFCFDIEPLPTVNQNLTFSCNTKNGATITNTVYVSSLDNNTYIADKTENNISVRNVVYVGASFKYDYFIYGSLADLSSADSGWNIGGEKQTYAVAYPQVNKCTPITGNECG